ncbi:hypothetical protein [Streptomyces sp. NPDC050507]|uniref:hypothetical protein n=1 Tax=Streptomyces sp. NPDC050507 TaxID=3365619 RepID=UPI00378CA32A
MSLEVRGEGFDAFRNALRDAATDTPRVVDETERHLAGEVVRLARRRADQLGGVAPKAARSLRVQRAEDGYSVRYGGAAYPYAMGAEFGSRRYGQFRAYRRAGYFVRQARYEVSRYRLRESFERAFSRAVREAFPDQ